MKAIILFMLFTLTSAYAEEIKVLEVGYGPGYPQVTLNFAANKKLGRAWIEARVDSSMPDSTLGDDFYRQKLEGLSYDEATDTIVLEKDGQLIECAKYDRGGFFRVSGFKPTGCTLGHRFVKVVVDDGYYTRKVDRVVIYLTIKDL